jgi:hypothetical protein
MEVDEHSKKSVRNDNINYFNNKSAFYMLIFKLFIVTSISTNEL